MNCEKCGLDLGENTVCPNCDSDKGQVEENTAPLGTNGDDSVSIDNNGEPTPTENTNNSPVVEKGKGGKRKTAAIILLAVFVAALVIAGVAALLPLLKNKKEKGYEFPYYIKDNCLYYIDPKEEKPVELTNSLCKDFDADADDILTFNAVAFADNNKLVFYPENYDAKTDCFSLYCKNLGKDIDAERIASNVEIYSVNNSGDLVVFSDTDNNLYKYANGEREKILSEIEKWYLSKDCSKLLYMSDDGGLYSQAIDGEKDKIDSNVETLYLYDKDNLDTFYYLKDDGTLFKKETDKDKIKIDSDVLETVFFGDNGYVYYTKENESKKGSTLLDYINDDNNAAETDKSAYDKLYGINSEADVNILLRHWSRKELEDRSVDFASYSLYSFNGEKSDLVNSAYVDIETMSDNAFIIKSYDKVDIKEFSIYDIADAVDKEIKWRELQKAPGYHTFYESTLQTCDFFDELEKIVEGAYETDATFYMINGNTINEIDMQSGSKAVISDNENEIYYTADIDEEKDTANLYKAAITNGKLESEKYDTDITPFGLEYDKTLGVIYFKDFKDGEGENADLYASKKVVEYDIEDFNILNDGKIVYWTETDDDYCGTMYLYENGEKKKISEDAYYYIIDGADGIYYYKDWSDGKGDLYVYRNNASERIDYDVVDTGTIDSEHSYKFIMSWHY